MSIIMSVIVIGLFILSGVCFLIGCSKRKSSNVEVGMYMDNGKAMEFALYDLQSATRYLISAYLFGFWGVFLIVIDYFQKGA